MSEGWWMLVIFASVFAGFILLLSAEDFHTEIVDERGCRVVEHIDNPIFWGDKTRTVGTYCPVDK